MKKNWRTRFSLYGLLLLFPLSVFAISAVQPDQTLPANNTPPAQTLQTPPGPDIEANSYVLMDAGTGKILASKNPDLRVAPASLTKMMTMYIVAEALKRGQIHLTDRVPISEKAWRMGGSKMFVKVGDTVPLEDLIKGIVIVSGNDACVAMAEYIAGSEDAFADLMNQQAKLLGMNNTHFTDSTGLPAANHYTTASDMALLGRATVMNHADYYHWHKEKEFTFNNILQYNRNRLLWRDPSVDGIKTGFTDDAGYCLVASAKKGDMRLISALMHSKSPNQRAEDSMRLLTFGFRFYTSQRLYKAGETLASPRTWYGKEKQTPVGLSKDIYVTLPVQQYKQLKALMELPKAIRAPLKKGEPVGRVKVVLQDNIIEEVPIVALQDNPKGSLWSRMRDSFGLFFHQWLSSDDTKPDNT